MPSPLPESIDLPITDKNVVCVLSGGLDSTILLYLLKQTYPNQVLALSFDYHQRHNIELECAKKTCLKTNTPHKIIPIQFFGDLISPISALSNKQTVEVPNIMDVLGHPQPVTYVPFRNMLFLTLAMSFAEVANAEFIFIGLQAHDLYMYWDTTKAFVQSMNAIAQLNRQHKIQIEAPFVTFSKQKEILIGERLQVPFEDTWTCYKGPNEKGEACGECPSCAERIKNFLDANKKDPIPYAIDIPWSVK